MRLRVPAVIAAQSPIVKALGGAVVVLLLVLAILAWRLRAAHAEVAKVQLARTNEAALATPSRPLNDKELAAIMKIVGDSVRGATKPVVQVAQRNDALDRVMAQDRVMLGALTASFAKLVAHETSTGSVVSTSNDSLRTASFDVRQVPYTAHATVTLPRPPAHGVLDLDVRLDSAHLLPRLGCGKAVNGIRPARYTVTGPTWLTIVIDSTSQDPAICNPQVAGLTRCRVLRFLPCVSRTVAALGGVIVGAAGAVAVTSRR